MTCRIAAPRYPPRRSVHRWTRGEDGRDRGEVRAGLPLRRAQPFAPPGPRRVLPVQRAGVRASGSPSRCTRSSAGARRPPGSVLVAQLIPAAARRAVHGPSLGDRLRRDTALGLGYIVQACAHARLLAIALWNGAAGRRRTRPPCSRSCAVTFTRPVHYAILPELADTPGAAHRRERRDRHDGRARHRCVGPAIDAALIVVDRMPAASSRVDGRCSWWWPRSSRCASALYRDAEPSAARAIRRRSSRIAVEGCRELPRRARCRRSCSASAGAQFFLIGLARRLLRAPRDRGPGRGGSSRRGISPRRSALGGLVGATVAVVAREPTPAVPGDRLQGWRRAASRLATVGVRRRPSRGRARC